MPVALPGLAAEKGQKCLIKRACSSRRRTGRATTFDDALLGETPRNRDPDGGQELQGGRVGAGAGQCATTTPAGSTRSRVRSPMPRALMWRTSATVAMALPL